MDFFSDAMRRDPYVFYEEARGRSPVLHVEPLKLWMIFDYDGVKRALSEPEIFGSSLVLSDRPTPEWFIFLDPPRHTKLRGLISRAFTPRSIALLETRIRAISRELLDRVIDRGEMDLAADFSIPLPTRVIAEMLGLPESDGALFKRWADVILALSYTISDAGEAARVSSDYRAATGEMKAYLDRLLDERRRTPRDDLLTRLLQAEVDGQRLSESEILGFFQLLLLAGTETTTNLINNAILCLLENSSQLMRLREHMDLLPSAIEEVLRYRSPLQTVFRSTKQAVELNGHPIPARQFVLAMIGSANRDPRQFPHADQFDITRDPNPHLGFGHGNHFCLGASLSRLEARIALTDLLQRLDNFSLASDEPWEPREAFHVHGPTRLPIRFNRGE